MNYVTRDGKIITNQTSQDNLLKHLYGTNSGRSFLKIATSPIVSKIGGKLLNTRLSSLFIDSFVKNNNIKLKEYIPKKYISYNDFFTRRIKSSSRPIDNTCTHLISPSDGKVSVYEIKKNLTFDIKNTRYSISTLLRDKKLAHEYQNGYCIVIRLTVDNYHRYCNVDNGNVITTKKINGVFHTVNPVANDYYPIYKENTREYTVIDSEHFGKIIQMEVGALMVGKIVNHKHSGKVLKGTEKGYFEFGGSTIVLLIKKENLLIDQDLLINTMANYETIVKMGEKIGTQVLTSPN